MSGPELGPGVCCSPRMERIEPLFRGWQETTIWSCLQGCMGRAYVDDEARPASAMIEVGDFAFFAGAPSRPLAQRAAAPILVPRDGKWAELLERVWGDRTETWTRYAMKKEPDCFDRVKLAGYAMPPEGFRLCLMEGTLYRQAMGEEWSRDMCAQFANESDYVQRGVGVAALRDGRLVAGASSYTVYRGGIEIEIDTKPEYRQKGLAAACGARLILECLDRGLYPSWDAHDLRSVALAEKLGYHLDHPYPVYCRIRE